MSIFFLCYIYIFVWCCLTFCFIHAFHVSLLNSNLNVFIIFNDISELAQSFLNSHLNVFIISNDISTLAQNWNKFYSSYHKVRQEIINYISFHNVCPLPSNRGRMFCQFRNRLRLMPSAGKGKSNLVLFQRQVEISEKNWSELNRT